MPTFQVVPGEGPSDASIVLVGERPGIDEDNAGRPFVGLSGQELDRYLESVGILREDVYVTNLVKVYADADPTADEVREWSDLLEAELASINPRIIGAVGAFSARYLLGPRYLDMDTQHGLPIRADGPDGGRLVLPIIHPASAFYDPEAGKLVQYDFQMLKALADGRIEPKEDAHQKVTYELEKPNISPVAPFIAIDTEGSWAKPWCLSWSAKPGEAWCQRTVQSPWIPKGHVLLHNSLHDLAVLDAMGVKLADGQFTDTMVLAYLLSVEPQGLKQLAYRHCGMVMDSYDDVLREASEFVALEYLDSIRDTDWGPTDQYAVVKDGKLVIKSPWSLNRYIERILADKAKKPETDVRKRWLGIEDYIKSPVHESIGEMPEADLSDVSVSRAINYACRDADATLRIYPILHDRIRETGQELVAEIDHAIIPMVDRMQRTGFVMDRLALKTLENKCDLIMSQQVANIELVTGCHINPGSPDQVACLLFDCIGLEPIKWTKGGTKGEPKASTQDKVLETLRFVHPVVPHILDYREAAKCKDSFCTKLPRYIKPDGRLRPNFRITRVSSGRLAANAPNLMAIPVRSDLGKQVRDGFVAGPGRVLGDWDLNQVEMRHMAEESGDEGLITIFSENRLDVHTDTASNMFNTPYDQVETWQRYAAKRVGFGVITGITGMGLVDQMNLANAMSPDGDPYTEGECDNFINRWFDVRPVVRSFMEAKRAEARRYGYVRDMWGRIRYLPGIHSPIPRVREEAGRQAHSHDIQAGAQGIMKVAMAAIWRELPDFWAAGYWIEPLLQIHDSLMFEMDDDGLLKEMVNEMVVRHMTTAFLKYFPNYRTPMKAKGKFGYRWSEL